MKSRAANYKLSLLILLQTVELLLTTDQNIDWAFEGTDLEQYCALNLVKKLVKDGCTPSLWAAGKPNTPAVPGLQSGAKYGISRRVGVCFSSPLWRLAGAW